MIITQISNIGNTRLFYLVLFRDDLSILYWAENTDGYYKYIYFLFDSLSISNKWSVYFLSLNTFSTDSIVPLPDIYSCSKRHEESRKCE